MRTNGLDFLSRTGRYRHAPGSAKGTAVASMAGIRGSRIVCFGNVTSLAKLVSDNTALPALLMLPPGPIELSHRETSRRLTILSRSQPRRAARRERFLHGDNRKEHT